MLTRKVGSRHIFLHPLGCTAAGEVGRGFTLEEGAGDAPMHSTPLWREAGQKGELTFIICFIYPSASAGTAHPALLSRATSPRASGASFWEDSIKAQGGWL